MDPVGNGIDFISREHIPGYFPMLLGHPVDEFGQVQGQNRHVQVLRSGQSLKDVQGDVASQNPLDQVVGKTIMAGLHRGVGGKDAQVFDTVYVPDQFLVPHLLDGPFKFIQQFQGQQAGVPFVEVVFLDFKTQFLQHPGAPETEDDFLFEPVGLVAAVKRGGDLPVFRGVPLHIGIQEKNRHLAPGKAFDHVVPGLDSHRPPLDLHENLPAQPGHKRGRVPNIGMFDLPAFFIQFLAKEPLPGEQGHRHHGQFQVGPGLDRVPGQHPQPAAVGGNIAVDPDLHGKIGDHGLFGQFHQ